MSKSQVTRAIFEILNHQAQIYSPLLKSQRSHFNQMFDLHDCHPGAEGIAPLQHHCCGPRVCHMQGGMESEKEHFFSLAVCSAVTGYTIYSISVLRALYYIQYLCTYLNFIPFIIHAGLIQKMYQFNSYILHSHKELNGDFMNVNLACPESLYLTHTIHKYMS